MFDQLTYTLNAIQDKKNEGQFVSQLNRLIPAQRTCRSVFR
jgi:hypothetical protein